MENEFDVHRLMNTNLLMEHSAARRLFSSLTQQQNSVSSDEVNGTQKASIRSYYGSYNNEENYRPYSVEDNIAVIPVNGVLLHKSSYIGRYTCGYDALISAIEFALSDKDVDAVLIDFDTPGGQVSGCFDATDRLFELSQNIPIASLCYDMHCSAGQALASACSYNMMTQTGEAGSIGVVMAHWDYSKQLEEMLGINITLIFSGSQKVHGNPYEKLPSSVLAKFQNQVDELRLQFANIVSKNLGLSTEQVLDTEAAIFRGDDAIKAGLCDVIVNGHQAVKTFRDYLSVQRKSTLGATMSNNNDNENINQETSATKPSGTDSNLSTDAPEANENKSPESTADERSRIKNILESKEATGRCDLAKHFAYETDMSVEDALSALAKAPKEESNNGDSAFIDTLMSKIDQPQLGPDQKNASGSKNTRVEEMSGSYKLATGR